MPKLSHYFKLDGCDPAEFDELFVSSATVHIERVAGMSYSMQITAPGLPDLRICTEVEKGRWFFSVEEDALNGAAFLVKRTLGRGKVKR